MTEEAWLRGPVAGVSPLLQPVAHALIQAREEVAMGIRELPGDGLWIRPAGAASAAFHLQHLSGALDRLFTYARGEPLDDAQRRALRSEGVPSEDPTTARELYRAFDRQVEFALDQLRMTAEETLTDPRKVGRAGLPSTVMGLLFHAAAHTLRHVGQLLVTVKVVSETRTLREG